MRAWILMLGLTLICMGCARQVGGGAHGDPTLRPKAASGVEPSTPGVDRSGDAVAVRLPPASKVVPDSPVSAVQKTAPAETDAGQKKAAVSQSGHSLPNVTAKPVPANPLGPRTITVGPGSKVASIAEAAKIARDGDVVEVRAGEYRGDVAVWTQKRLTIRAVGGRAVLIADGKAAEGKGIWVIRYGEFLVEGFDFTGTRVSGRNGAGIRFESGKLTIRNSRFIDNQMGLLTGNNQSSELIIDRCEFSGPRDGDHWYHNLYVGAIGKFIMTNSRSYSARVGHLVKSRARENIITDNKLVDGDGSASYELEFPSGGIATVERNRIEQSPKTENPVIVSFGAEGYTWPRNELRMSNNILINHAEKSATFVRIRPGADTSILSGNRWVGVGTLQISDEVDDGTNRFESALKIK